MLNRVKNTKFTTKLFVAMLSVVIVSLLITSGNAIRMSKQGLYTLGEGSIENIHTALYNSLDAIDENLRKKLDSDLTLLEKEISENGAIVLNDNTTIVDDIEKITTSSATIFQLVDDKLLRIATTVKTLDGERAVGTYIPSDSPVYKTVLSGETSRGKAYVANDWYLTAYKPLKNSKEKNIKFLPNVLVESVLRSFLI